MDELMKELLNEQEELREAVVYDEFKEAIKPAINNSLTAPLVERLKVFLKSESGVRGFVVFGRAGIGKTKLVLSTLKEEGVDFVYLNNHSTPLSFYKKAYENKDKVLVFDDIEALFSNKANISLLKALLGSVDSKTIVTYETTSSKADGVPSSFLFEGKVIILTNIMPKDELLLSLYNRCINFDFDLKYYDIVNMGKDVITSNGILGEKEAEEVIEFIKDNATPYTKNFSFRNIIRIAEYRKHSNNWKELALSEMIQDEDMSIIAKIIEKYDKTEEQFRAWKKATNKARRTFFRKKKKFSEITGNARIEISAKVPQDTENTKEEKRVDELFGVRK